MRVSDTIIRLLPSAISEKLLWSDNRLKEAEKNIFLSFGTTCISLLTSFLLVPLTINYVNATQYGIWLTVSSVVGWVTMFNLGLGNGFRNKYAEAKAKGDIILARQYLSTTYFALSCLIFILLSFFLILNHFIDWTNFLKVDENYREELKNVFGIVSIFFCLNMVARVFNTLLIADQKPGLSNVVDAVGQLMSLAVIFLLTKFTEGSLYKLALYFSGVSCFVVLLSTFITFGFTEYRKIRPSIFLIRHDLIKDILSLGIKFFIIDICVMAIFQVINIVISREIGPEAVTQYNISYKYFYVLACFMSIVITPFWSAFTDAYTKKDYSWMSMVIRKLEKCWLFSILVGIIMLAISPWFYNIWIGKSVHIPFLLSMGSMLYILSQILASVYMQTINGVGTVRIQLIVYVLFALVSWPLLTFSCRLLGVYGIVITPTLVYVSQAIVGRIQINKLINQKAIGLWGK